MLSVEIPKVFQFEITNVCNLRCPYCPFGRGDFKPKYRYLPKSDIESWIKRGDFEGTDRLEGLHVMGEPTLHPQWFDIVELFGEYGISVMDATNCTMFIHDWFVDKALKLDNLVYWVLSVDASKYEEWVGAKGVDFGHRFWTKMINGLSRFLRETPFKVAVRTINSPWTGNPSLFKEFWGKFEAVNSNVRVEVKFLDTIGGRYQWVKHRPSLKQARGICPEPFRNVVVLCNGDVVPCCYIYDAAIKYGNLYEADLRTIWATSPTRIELIADMVFGRYCKMPCANCHEWCIPSDVEVVDDGFSSNSGTSSR